MLREVNFPIHVGSSIGYRDDSLFFSRKRFFFVERKISNSLHPSGVIVGGLNVHPAIGHFRFRVGRNLGDGETVDRLGNDVGISAWLREHVHHRLRGDPTHLCECTTGENNQNERDEYEAARTHGRKRLAVCRAGTQLFGATYFDAKPKTESATSAALGLDPQTADQFIDPQPPRKAGTSSPGRITGIALIFACSLTR